MHDLLIRNGRIVDGTGRAAYESDLTIDGGRITAIERIGARRRRVIDANGAIVTPGFVDIHTHYDGQATWDDTSRTVGESRRHHRHRRQLRRRLRAGAARRTSRTRRTDGRCRRHSRHRALRRHRVELGDLPAVSRPARSQALVDGRRHPRAARCGARLCDGRARRAERSLHRRRHAQMAAITREAIAAGAFGFSTSRILGHQSINGLPVPGTFAGEDEVFAIGDAMAHAARCSNWCPAVRSARAACASARTDPPHDELDWMARLSKNAPADHLPDRRARRRPRRLEGRVLRSVAKANEGGARLFPQTAARPAGFLIGFQCHHLFQRRPTYLTMADLPFDRRVAALRTPEVRSAILSEADLPPLVGIDQRQSASDHRGSSPTTSSRSANRSTTSPPSTRPLRCRPPRRRRAAGAHLRSDAAE